MNRPPRLFLPWVALASVCCVLMWLFPGDETIPYHLAWIGIAAAYGLETWPRSKAYSAVVALTVVSGVILVERAATGYIPWDETGEIPMMSLLMGLMVWHVRRRHEAVARLTLIGDRDRRRAAQRERLSRMTSHEMRTPATIAVGYLELLLQQEEDPQRQSDLHVVLEELDRILLGADRLVRMLWIPEQDELRVIDVDAILTEVSERWRVLAERDWQVESTSGRQHGNPARIRSCLDTLVENSVRYTEPGDVVRLVSFVSDGTLTVGVEDSGSGFDQGLADLINAASGSEAAKEGWTLADPKAQTGLGLGLVREAIATRGGRIHVGCSPEGGARVLMVSPRDSGGQAPTTGGPEPLAQPVTPGLQVVPTRT